MAASRKKFVIGELKAYNKNLDKEFKDEKFCKMAINPYAFYRGTDHLYWADYGNDKRIKKFSSLKTKTWLQGDLHVYNLGTFDNDQGDLVYGLNDFDESVIADYQFDVWRLAISLILVARQNGKSKKKLERELVETFAEAYLKHVDKLVGTNKEDKFDYIAKNTKAPLRNYMKVVDVKNQKSRAKMLHKWTKNEKFNTESVKLGKVTPKERKILKEAIEGKNGKSPYRKTLKGHLRDAPQSYFKVLDVAARLLAGTGSLGTKRFYVLINGPKKSSKYDTILDVKCQGDASWTKYLSKEDRKINKFDNNAERTIEGYRALARKVDDHLGWVELPRLSKEAPAGFYSIRERSPEKDSFPALLADLKPATKKLALTKKSNFLSMCKQWGQILATSHARADNDKNKGRIEYSFEKNVKKQTKGKEDKFVDLVYEIASEYADQVEQDFKYFTGWFDASKCPKP